jgi:glycosyltransferase involved in cell wall biosynthesis
MRASVIVPAYNAEKTIEECLKALLEQDFPKQDYEIIVVDDGSTDGTAKVAAKYPVRVIRQKHAGPAAARNAGARNARGEIFVFTDADCRPRSNWLSTLLSSFAAADIGGVGGPYETSDEGPILSRIIGREIAYKHARMPKFVDYLGSFNCAYRKDLFQKAGGFDESFMEASGEDNDLSYRVAAMGYRLVFNPKAIVAHKHPSKLADYLRKQFKHAMWRAKLYKKHPKKVRGDIYAGVSTLIVQPLLYSTFIFAFIVSSFLYEALPICFCLLISIFLMHALMALRIYKNLGTSIVLTATLLFFLRGFAWILGSFAGIIRFWLKTR